MADCTHAFITDLREANIRFAVGYEVDERVREAALKVEESAWSAAIEPDGEERDGAWVAELTEHLDLSAWGEGGKADLPPRASAPGRTVSDLRRAWLPVHVLSHRPR